MATISVAEWADDGFLHPPETLNHEFVDVDGFRRFPIQGLTEIVQFARVLVGEVEVIVFEPNGTQFQHLLEEAFHACHPGARHVFLASAKTGIASVRGKELTEVDAIAVAVTQFRCAWDESEEIRVSDDQHIVVVTVTYQNDSYVTSSRTETVA